MSEHKSGAWWAHGIGVALTLGAMVAVSGERPARAQSRELLPRLQDYLTRYIQLTPQELESVRQDRPVTKLLPGDAGKEVAVFGIVWIAADPQVYVDALLDIENFEKGGAFRVTKKISTPPVLQDFAALELPDDDVKALRTCRVGDCEIKLSESALNALRKEVDFSRPDAEQQVTAFAQRLALQFVQAYLKGGNAELAVYRDQANPTFVAKEFQTLVDQAAGMAEFTPELKDYLLNFPNVSAPQARSFLYWQEANFGLKPTVRINHVVILPNETGGVSVASKQIYASHYFWTALEARVLVKDANRPGGFYFVTVNRSRSDGLSGMVGRLIRGKVRGEARKGMETVLLATKKYLESANAY